MNKTDNIRADIIKTIHDTKKPITNFFMLLSSIEDKVDSSQKDLFEYLKSIIKLNEVKIIEFNKKHKNQKTDDLVNTFKQAFSFIILQLDELEKKGFLTDYRACQKELEKYLFKIDTLTNELIEDSVEK